MEKIKILFLGLQYPEHAKAPNMYSDLMASFISQNHNVTVIAPSFGKEESCTVDELNIRILRLRTIALFGNNIFIKGLSNVSLPFIYKRGYLKYFKGEKFDLIITPTPPITLFGFANWVKSKCNARLYLILRDIFPQNAVDLKMMKNRGLLYQYFRKMEKKLYSRSDSIGCMSPENINYVLKHNLEVNPKKLHLLPNWEDSERAISSRNTSVIDSEISKKFENKFIALYGGNIGKPQQLENIIDLADRVQKLTDVLFLIIGWGTEKNKVKNYCQRKELKNVVFLDSVSSIEYVSYLKIAHMGLISLNKDFTIPNFPSKINAYYTHKLPVLISVDSNTDFGIIQTDIVKCGLWSVAGDLNKLEQNFLTLYNDPIARTEMGLNGYNYLINQLSPSKAASTIIEKSFG